MRLNEATREFLDALGAYLNAENPSRSNAISFLARKFTPPTDLDPLALRVRTAHRELTKP
jgi:hypothetical protein